jgi:hypothetical protein
MPIAVPPTTQHDNVAIYLAVGRSEAETDSAYISEIQRSFEQQSNSAFWLTNRRFQQAREDLKSSVYTYQKLPYAFEPPSVVAQRITSRILVILEETLLAPAHLGPSADGGLGITFVNGDKRAVIEVDNDGEIVAGTYSDVDDPDTWETDEARIPRTIEQIRVYLTV